MISAKELELESLSLAGMPPILSTLDDGISNLILSAQRQQKDLSEFQIPRLRTCNGPLPLQQNLAAELREDIEAFARKVEVSCSAIHASFCPQKIILGFRYIGRRPDGGGKTEGINADCR